MTDSRKQVHDFVAREDQPPSRPPAERIDLAGDTQPVPPYVVEKRKPVLRCCCAPVPVREQLESHTLRKARGGYVTGKADAMDHRTDLVGNALQPSE